MALTLRQSLQLAAQAGRGSLRALETILRSIVSGEAGEEIQFLDGVTAGTGAASKALVLDSSGNLTIPGEVQLDGNTGPTAGAGITAATGELYKTSVQKVGDIITTTIIVDVTGLVSAATENDIIGDDDAASAHLGQITAAKNGTIIGGVMTCLEAPTTGEIDIDVSVSSASTGAEDADVTGLAGYAKIFDAAADWTLGLRRTLSAAITADYYLYMSVGTGTTPAAGEYATGIFKIELYGYDA